MCGGRSPMASRMVWAGLYGPRSVADPLRTGSGVCDVGGEPCCAATAPVAGSTNAALTPTATSPAAVRRRRMELRMVMLTSPSSTHRPGMAADLPPWPQGGLDPPQRLQSKSHAGKYTAKSQDQHEHEFAQVHGVWPLRARGFGQ